MLAQRLPTILPDLTFEEYLEIAKIHSIAGILSNDYPLFIPRPFRNPHHTVSKSGFVGGGIFPKPGEISLAHLGVLFLDELPEFKHEILELLRTPLEERKITINRFYGSLNYPANFMMIASMNPCPCGYYGSSEKECTCSKEQISKYMHKISGPLLDRIDIHIEVQPIKYIDLANHTVSETSEKIKKRVNSAKQIQLQRYKNDKIFSNAELTPALIKKYCALSPECNSLLEKAFKTLNLSARAHDRILKLARTIADLDNSENIKLNHLAEAIQYRSLDRKYWS